MNALVLDPGNGTGSKPVHEHVEGLKGHIDKVGVSIPNGKIGYTTVYVSKRTAELHEQDFSGTLSQQSIGNTTSYSEAVGNLRDGYELRTIAILNEDTLKVTLIPDEADDVPGQYIVEGKGVDYIQFYPDTLVGNILPAEQAMKMFRKKKK